MMLADNYWLQLIIMLRLICATLAYVPATWPITTPKEEAGAWMAFSVKPGPVTLLSITSDQKGFHFVAIRGEALPAKGRLQGNPNALVKLEMPLGSFFAATTTVGTTQHWALVPGDLRGSISKLAHVLGIDCIILDRA